MREQQIEKYLLDKLKELKYDYKNHIRDKASLEKNFREKFETLNKVKLSDSEFERLLEQIITPNVFTAAKTLRAVNDFIRDDETPLNYMLVNVKDWCKNTFECINQLRINTGNSHHRYDVILLINGLPVVQIELKASAVSPRRAMQQIVTYKNHPDNGYTRTLMCFMQMFIVSNKEDTWYFANNNASHFNFNAEERFLSLYQFAGEGNEKITQLDKFAEKFLAKCILGQMISRYMVLVASEQKMLMMRPYQIYAVKAIVDCIHQNCGNGYIWHTTGSGKTLTSFKASTLLKDNADIEKCLFVVDRKDLDRQTREEFNRFQKGCVEENTNTKALVERLLSDDYSDKVIVTTIQKLGLALDGKNKRNYKKQLEPLRNKRVVFIFDECHRSQFGENHKAIREFFPNAQLFGFTGTPIFDDNATYKQIDGTQALYKTTESIFQHKLHEYTITHAIEDNNVLRFHIDSFKPTIENKPNHQKLVSKQSVIDTILKKHDRSTNNRRFNAILATAKIDDAIEYYNLLKDIQSQKLAKDSSFKPLNIACMFSPPAEGNKDNKQMQEDLLQEKLDNAEKPEEKKKALKNIIADYNKQYQTNHNVNEFDHYYQDVQKRIKDQQYSNADVPHSDKIDLMIVVDMLLTGFDAQYLNTLYVDKSLKYHGLIQAFSRTNRVLNDTKPYGNILDFRQQEDSVDKAIALFSGKSVGRAKEIWFVDEAPKMIEKLKKNVQDLDRFMKSEGLKSSPEGVKNLKGDIARTQFINIYKEVQRKKIQLDQYTDLTEKEKQDIEQIISKEQLQDFKGVYIETVHRLRQQKLQWSKNRLNSKQKNVEIQKEVQDLDFEPVLFSSTIIDYDYIMNLIAKCSSGKLEMNSEQLSKLIESDAKFIDEREDIKEYIKKTLATDKGFSEKQIKSGYEEFKLQKNDIKIEKIASEYKIEKAELQKFIDKIIRRLVFDDSDLTDLLLPLGLGWKERTRKKLSLMEKLIPVLHNLSDGKKT